MFAVFGSRIRQSMARRNFWLEQRSNMEQPSLVAWNSDPSAARTEHAQVKVRSLKHFKTGEIFITLTSYSPYKEELRRPFTIQSRISTSLLGLSLCRTSILMANWSMALAPFCTCVACLRSSLKDSVAQFFDTLSLSRLREYVAQGLTLAAPQLRGSMLLQTKIPQPSCSQLSTQKCLLL